MKISGCWFDVFFKELSPPKRGKLGVAVSKKVIKLAVDRNKIKRRVRAIVWELALDLATVCHIKVAVKPGAAGQKFGEVKYDLAAVFQTARKRLWSK